MDGFLNKAGLKIFALFLSLILVFTLSLSTVSAQDDMADFDWDAWEAQMEQALDDTAYDTAWTESDDTWDSWDDDSWGTGYTYDTTTEFEGDDLAALGLALGIWGVVMGIMFLPLYLYFALSLMTIAKKLDISSAWFAWIPGLNLILLCRCAGITSWLFLLFFIPLANVVALIIVYMKIAERRGFESWLGILMIVPIAQLVIPGYLAWAEPPKKAL